MGSLVLPTRPTLVLSLWLSEQVVCWGQAAPLRRYCYKLLCPRAVRNHRGHFPQEVPMAQITEAFSAYGWQTRRRRGVGVGVEPAGHEQCVVSARL